MKIMCPGHYCVLENQDKYILETNCAAVEVVQVNCPFCREELKVLNILLGQIRYEALEDLNLEERCIA